MAKDSSLKASVLAFERKMDPSDAQFAAGNWDDRANGRIWPPVTVREKSVRGTISNRPKGSGELDPAKLDASIQKPNLQTVDVATLPLDADTLRVCFTLRVLGGAGAPSACNNHDYLRRLQEIVNLYATEIGFGELARRYAQNLANARFLWRNRIGSEAVEVRVSQMQDGQEVQKWTFDAMQYPLRDFGAADGQDLATLAKVIENGLAGEGYVLLLVEAYARVGAGQEVFPSQELVLSDRGNDKGRKSKTLYAVGPVAAMHSQKIGNALRTIDTWYHDDDGLGPIAVEPYGSVTSLGRAFRQPKEKMDFYSLFDAWVARDKRPSLEQQHFVMATLVRGGVFGESEKD